jgi:hypothetical protein
MVVDQFTAACDAPAGGATSRSPFERIHTAARAATAGTLPPGRRVQRLRDGTPRIHELVVQTEVLRAEVEPESGTALPGGDLPPPARWSST